MLGFSYRSQFAALFLLTAPACYTSRLSEVATAERWIGAPTEKLLNVLGYPSQTMQLPNGNTVMIYREGRTTRTPVTVHTIGSTSIATGGQDVTRDCALYFEVGATGKVLRWHQQGNACAD